MAWHPRDLLQQVEVGTCRGVGQPGSDYQRDTIPTQNWGGPSHYPTWHDPDRGGGWTCDPALTRGLNSWVAKACCYSLPLFGICCGLFYRELQLCTHASTGRVSLRAQGA